MPKGNMNCIITLTSIDIIIAKRIKAFNKGDFYFISNYFMLNLCTIKEIFYVINKLISYYRKLNYIKEELYTIM